MFLDLIDLCLFFHHAVTLELSSVCFFVSDQKIEATSTGTSTGTSTARIPNLFADYSNRGENPELSFPVVLLFALIDSYETELTRYLWVVNDTQFSLWEFPDCTLLYWLYF